MDSTLMVNKVLNLDKTSWKLTKVGDLAKDISKRVDNPGESEYDRFVSLRNFVAGDIKIKTWEPTENLASSAKAFKAGDILFARRNAYLRRASLVDFDGCCSGDAFVLRENHDKIVPGFLAFLMNSNALWDYANSNAAGTMSKRVKWRDLAEYEFLLPPKDQQAQLAKLLWAMDELIEKEKMLYDSIETCKLALEKSSLSEIDISSGIPTETFFDRVTDGTHDTPKKRSEGYRLLTSKNIKDNKLDLNTDYFISEFDYQAVNKRSKPDINDILFGMIGTVGQVSRIDTEPNYAIKNMGLFKTNDELKSKIGFHFFKSRQFQHKLISKLSGTTQKYVSLAYLRSLKMPDPEDPGVLEWLEKSEYFDSTIETVNTKLVINKSLQKSLINQIF